MQDFQGIVCMFVYRCGLLSFTFLFWFSINKCYCVGVSDFKGMNVHMLIRKKSVILHLEAYSNDATKTILAHHYFCYQVMGCSSEL
jgi:hypothetical protein